MRAIHVCRERTSQAKNKLGKRRSGPKTRVLTMFREYKENQLGWSGSKQGEMKEMEVRERGQGSGHM